MIRGARVSQDDVILLPLQPLVILSLRLWPLIQLQFNQGSFFFNPFFLTFREAGGP